MMKFQCSCRIFLCTLDGRETIWYHSHPPNSIQNWRGFKKLFLQKFFDDKTPTMLLRELGSLKMEQKEKVKYFNQRFNCILNRFPADTILGVRYILSTTSICLALVIMVSSTKEDQDWTMFWTSASLLMQIGLEMWIKEY